jgi:hypothetical protein
MRSGQTVVHLCPIDAALKTERLVLSNDLPPVSPTPPGLTHLDADVLKDPSPSPGEFTNRCARPVNWQRLTTPRPLDRPHP